MKSRFLKTYRPIVAGILLSGCGAMIDAAIVGPGKSATAEDTGFLANYSALIATRDPAHRDLPDLYYIAPQAHIASYEKVLVPDFSSLASDVNKLKGLQIRQYKTIKQDLADQIASTLDGTMFTMVSRTSERTLPKDTDAIKKLPADAVLMGNIKELASSGGEDGAGLTAIQVEYKLVDVATGEEVVTAIHRSTTDLDKVAMAQVRALAGLLNKAKTQ